MENEVYSILEKSFTQELFLLRILTRESVLNGLAAEFPKEILRVGGNVCCDSLYDFIRLLLTYSHKSELDVSRNNIIQQLANLPINNSIINSVFNNLIDANIYHPQVRRELLFTVLVREVDPEIPIPEALQRYVTHIGQYEMR